MIAISYRREDSLPIAGRLYDRLQAKFGKKNVFMDFDSIPPGADFRQQIKQMIERSKLVIAIIGPHWLGEQPDASRRIDNPADFVRLEIAYALERGIPVIPVLVNNTPMPRPEKLPQEIEGLAFRNAVTLDTGIDFHHHADRLITGIGKAMDIAPRLRAPRKVSEPTASAANRRPLSKIVIWSAAILLAGALLALAVRYVATHKPQPAKQVATANESKSDKSAQPFSESAPTVKPSVSIAPSIEPSSPLPLASVQPTPLVEQNSQPPVAKPSLSPSAPPNDTGAQKLTKVFVKKYGFSVLLPTEFFPDAALQLADANTDHLVSVNGCFRVAFNVLSGPVKKAYDNCIAGFRKKTNHITIDYKVLKDTWFVVSGESDNTGYYTKGVKRGDNVILMELEYTGAACNAPDAMLTEMSRKFDGN